MNITESQLRKQIEKLRALKLLPAIEAAAETYGAGVFDAADLIAIGSRESNFNDKWLKVAGDAGNGFGWMQADKRSFPEWIRTGAWKDPAKAFEMGARILRDKLADTTGCEGVRFTVRDKAGRVYTCERGKRLSKRERYMVALAAYNCGRWAHYHVSKGRDIDTGTTGKDYAADVAERARFIRGVLKRDGRATLQANSFITAAVVPTIETVPAPMPEVSNSPAQDEPKFEFKDVTRHVSKDAAMSFVKKVSVPASGALVTAWSAGLQGKIVLVAGLLIALVIVVMAVRKYQKQLRRAVAEAIKG